MRSQKRTPETQGHREDRKQGTPARSLALFLLSSLCLCASGVSSASAADNVQEFVFLGEARPVFVRLHVRVDGQPVPAAWDDGMKYLFGYLDVNGDGVLSKDEAERVPTVEQILSGGLNRGGRGGAPAMGPTLEALDADKDGKVTREELAAYYRKGGFVPFQFQLDPPAGNPLGAAAALFGGGRAEPAVTAVAEAAFALVDANHDGKVTREELAAAGAALLRLDENEDETVTTTELVPDVKPPNPLDFGAMMAGGSRSSGAAGNKYLVPLTTPGEAPANLVRFLQERYGPKTDKSEEKKISRKDLGLSEAVFRQLDVDGNGLLDAKELAGLVKLTPDLELTMRLGRKEAAAVEITGPRPAELRVQDGLALLDLGVTRLDLRCVEENRPDRFGGFLQQQLLVQLKQADSNGDGVIDENEAKTSRAFRGLFTMVDRDGDGKVTEKELTAYLDHLRELQTRAVAGCVTLVLTDQSRGLFDLLDANRDGRLSVREMRQAPELLKALDRDGKGYLTQADIPHSYRVALRRGPAEQGGNPAALAALYLGGDQARAEPEPTAGPAWFRKMDRNRDGDVSRREFLFSDEMFRRLDRDGDGLISREEAEKADTPASPQKGNDR